MPQLLAIRARPGETGGMSRTPIAVAAGLIGFLLYVGVVLALADHVLHWHWLLQVPFFAVAGLIWAWPAKWLMFWAARK